MTRARVLLNNYNGLAVRNFGHTRFPAAVAAFGELEVLSNSSGPECERLDFGAERIGFAMPPETPAIRRLLYLRKDAFFHAHRIHTHLVKEERLRRPLSDRLPSRALRLLPGLAGFRLVDRIYGAWLRARPETRALAHELEMRRPCAVLDLLHNNMSGALLKSAADRCGIPVCGFVYSWDKLTTKNPIHGTCDRYLVWSEAMKRELLALYPWVRPESVVPTGTPQFDYYWNPEYLLAREELCRRLGLDPARPILAYTAVSVGYSGNEDRLLEVLIRALEEAFGAAMPSLVIRPRPNPFAPNQTRYRSLERLAPGRVRVMDAGWPVRQSADGRSAWGIPNREDMIAYTSLMRHTDVGLAISSTTVLEWVLCDRPVVNLCFDPDEPARPDPATRWMVGFSHYRLVREGPGVAFTEGLMPALHWIRRCLEEPDFHAEGRRQMRETVLHCQDGRCAERVAAWALDTAGCAAALPLHGRPPEGDPRDGMPPMPGGALSTHRAAAAVPAEGRAPR